MVCNRALFFTVVFLSCVFQGHCTEIFEKQKVSFDIETPPLLSCEDRDLFFENGFLILKGIFKEQVSELKERCNSMASLILDRLSDSRFGESKCNQATYFRGAQVVFKKEVGKAPKIVRIVGCGSYDPFFLNCLRSYKIVKAFSFLLNADTLEHLICQCHLKLPNDGTAFNRHKDIDNRKNFDPDWKDIGGECSYAVGIVAVDSMHKGNGGLMLELGSHKGEENKGVFAPSLDPGDFLIMHPYLIHSSGSNESEMSRMTLLTGFCVAGANHRNYPGNCTNTLISSGRDGFLEIKNAPWKIEDDESFKVK